MMYNAPMNFLKYSSFLLRCCLAVTLVFSLWTAGAQDFFAQDMLDKGGIMLNIDADSPADDSFEQAALIFRTPAMLFVANPSGYPGQSAQPVLPACFSPPDRPPAHFV